MRIFTLPLKTAVFDHVLLGYDAVLGYFCKGQITIHKIMEFRYRVFMAAANHLSFSKAAKELGISQPALTSHIRELENKFGSSLFFLLFIRIELAPQGEIVYEYAYRAFLLDAELEQKMRMFDLWDESAEIRIGASSHIAQYLLPDLCVEFSNYAPQITFRWTIDNAKGLKDKLSKKELDVCFFYSSHQREPGNSSFFNADVIPVIKKGANHLVHNSATLSYFTDFTWLLDGEDADFVSLFNQYFSDEDRNSFSESGYRILPRTEIVKSLVASTKSLTFLPFFVIRKEIDLGKLTVPALKDFSLSMGVRMKMSSLEDGNIVQRFGTFAKEFIQGDHSDTTIK